MGANVNKPDEKGGETPAFNAALLGRGLPGHTEVIIELNPSLIVIKNNQFKINMLDLTFRTTSA